MRVIGHRGAMGCQIENTIPSFHEALRQGATGLEMDIRRARSGELVVFHDDDLQRLVGGDGRIEELDLAEIEGLTVRDPNLPDPVGRIVSLEGVVEDPLIGHYLKGGPERLMLSLEIKGRDIEEPLMEFIQERSLTDQVIVYAFHLDVLRTVQRLNPDLWTNLLFGEERERHLQMAVQHGITMINPEAHDVDRAFVDAARRMNRLVSVGRTNDVEQIQRLVKLDVWGIHSDWPERVAVALRKGDERAQ